MSESNVVNINRPEEITTDSLTELIREGARKILEAALEAEIEVFLEQYKSLKTEGGTRRVTRNGYLPERTVLTGIGGIEVKAPRIRDKELKTSDSPIRFSSSILPRYLRKSKSVEELLPWLYLKGISAGDMQDALSSLLGPDAQGISQPVVSKLKRKWEEDYENWNRRDLSNKKYVYIWADGIYSQVRMDDKQCLLVIIGATPSGKKELIAVEGGFRESALSWRSVLLDLKMRGLATSPELAIGDGAMGFWKALAEVFPETRWQRCWVHKTANILNKLPKKIQSKAKESIHQIWMAENRSDAQKALECFIKTYEAKYPKATETLLKDKESLLTFYDFPAEHWRHIRTTNPIESTFATVRLRTAKVRGCFSSKTILVMAFKLCQNAEKKWHKLFGSKRLGELITGVKFINGISESELNKAA